MITVERNTTSVSAFSDTKSYLKLYPVPAVDDLTIEWLGSVDNSTIEFKVNDVRGRLIDQFKLHSETGPNYYKMDIRNLAPMTYIISTVVDGVLMNGKFIKK
jgi:hypothetical protein